jgi:hypothetical protein
MADRKVLMVKFARGGDPAEQRERIRKLVGESSVEDASQVFPDDSDEELATLFEVVLSERASVEEAKASLDGDQEIEYTHEPAEKKGL